MSGLYLILLLVLPVAALASRRLPMTTVLKGALAWIAIFGLLYLIMTWFHFT